MQSMIDLMTDEVDDMNQFLLGIPHLESETVDVPDDKESKEEKDVMPTLPTKEPSADQQSATTAALKPSSTEDAKSKTDNKSSADSKSTDPKSTDSKSTDNDSNAKTMPQRWSSYSHIAN